MTSMEEKSFKSTPGDGRGGHSAEKDSTMAASVHDLAAKRIDNMRAFIDDLLRDIGGASFATLRGVAHDALNKLLQGDNYNANIGFNKLGPENERLVREKLAALGFEHQEKT